VVGAVPVHGRAVRPLRSRWRAGHLVGSNDPRERLGGDAGLAPRPAGPAYQLCGTRRCRRRHGRRNVDKGAARPPSLSDAILLWAMASFGGIFLWAAMQPCDSDTRAAGPGHTPLRFRLIFILCGLIATACMLSRPRSATGAVGIALDAFIIGGLFLLTARLAK